MKITIVLVCHYRALLWTEEEIQLVMNQTMFADIAYNGSFFEAPLHDNIHIFVGNIPKKEGLLPVLLSLNHLIKAPIIVARVQINRLKRFEHVLIVFGKKSNWNVISKSEIEFLCNLAEYTGTSLNLTTLKNIRQRKFRQVARISSASASASAGDRHRVLPYHCISQSFDLPPATISVSHLTCPLPPHHQSGLALELELVLVLEIELALVLDIEHYGITASVSHLICPLPPHQSVI